LGNVTESVRAHPPESIGPAHDGSTIRADACGYPGEWGRRGEGDPTNPAEAPKSIEAENAIQAEKAESVRVQAENVVSAEVSQNPDGSAEKVSMPTQSRIDLRPDSAIEEAWWQWI
jgi:hypothetical protein